MKGFQKLALVSAIAALPAAGFAMEALDDATMSGVTGQDGISISLGLALSQDIWIEDTDGVTSFATDGVTPLFEENTGTATTPVMTAVDLEHAGFLAIRNVALNGTANINIDTGSRAGTNGTGGVLNIGIDIPTLTIGATGVPMTIGVTGSDAAAGDRVAADGLTRVANSAGGVTNIVSLGQIELTNLGLGVQLGPDAAQFLSISVDNAFDIAMTDFILNDVSGGGGLYVNELEINGINLDGTTGSITTAGLVLELGAASGMSVALTGLALGDVSAAPGTVPAALGNVYVTNLSLGATTVTISGK